MDTTYKRTRPHTRAQRHRRLTQVTETVLAELFWIFTYLLCYKYSTSSHTCAHTTTISSNSLFHNPHKSKHTSTHSKFLRGLLLELNQRLVRFLPSPTVELLNLPFPLCAVKKCHRRDACKNLEKCTKPGIQVVE